MTDKYESPHIYYGGGKAFPVTEEDLVFVKTQGKLKPTGFNHYRAWHAAGEYAATLRSS